jgi:signal transduction histidine kinase
LQIHEIIDEIWTLAHREITERRITLHVEASNNLPRVFADRVEIQQVLLNLVINAIDAMSGLEDARRILSIRGQSDELNDVPAVCITVHDLGIGVAVENLDRLFDSFYTTKPEGMGLGLPISRSIVEAHGGRLWATPNAGPGMTFACALPAQTAGAP